MSPVRMERLEAGIRVVLEFVEACNRADLAGMARLLGEDCVLEPAAPGSGAGSLRGKAELVSHWQGRFTQTAQPKLEVEELFGLGLRCVLRWRREGPQAGGKRGATRGATLFKLSSGLICEILEYGKF
jgi:ketosteroid isomerase-like protein